MNFVFFTDRDLGRHFPDALTASGVAVERHDRLFPPNCRDEVWLEYVGKNQRIAITHNRRIRYVPNELAAVMQHEVGLLVVIGKAPLPELARNFVNTMPRIVDFLRTHTPPFVAKVYRPSPAQLAKQPDAPGTISLWHPRSGAAGFSA